jgi:cell division protein FtsL
MTAAQHATAPLRAPVPAPAPAPRRRPPLRVVRPDEGPAVDRRRRARLRLAVTVLVVVAGLFGLVASHVLLTQDQFRLQHLESKAAAEQARYERLRLQVAELESPQRIVAAAQERLGMVPPPGVRYLSPTGVADQPKAGPQQGSKLAAGDDWSSVKPHLASRP